jgi:hypothetical protein
MKVKTSLRSRIRGWFPKEPNFQKTLPSRGALNRRVLVWIAVSVTVFVLAVGGVFVFLSWSSEQVLENLKGYSARLQDAGFTVESQSLGASGVEFKHEWYWFGDFRSYAKQENVTTVYLDRELCCLYYFTPLSPSNATLEANILYYNRVWE